MPLVLAALVALAIAAAAPAAAQPGPLYEDGPAGRTLLGGDWRFRMDAERTWRKVRVPHAWNAGDPSPESMRGGVAWYRRDLTLEPGRWVVRFESVNSRASVYLNGKRIGFHRGAHLAFEVDLRDARAGRNRLEVRVDSRRTRSDFPPYSQTPEGLPTGGWWNYGGLLREVYLRRVDAVDIENARVTPEVACTTCPADVEVLATVRNRSRRPQTVRVAGTFGSQRLRFPRRRLAPRSTQEIRGRVRVRRPHLWSPADPHLYRVRLEAGAARYSLRTGVRDVRVLDGRLHLNFAPVNVRGVGFHEEVAGKGAALSSADREWLVAETRALGATMLRTHYPPHPHLHELADEQGLLIWSEIPVYSTKNGVLGQSEVRAAAVAELERNIEVNGSHPSVVVWSVANELSANAGPAQGLYFAASARAAERMDPSRPVGYAFAGYPSSGCQGEYAPLDVVGVNDYFGWYPGPNGELFDREGLSGYLDALRACYPDKALMVTEFGAEANRDGPVEEKGTFAFQQDFADYHLGVFATKPYLSGAVYWALNEFWVRPGWEGGNPRPAPPLHQKGLVRFDRSRKPAFENVRRAYTAVRQFGR